MESISGIVTVSYCACGRPLHYNDPSKRKMVERFIAEGGAEIMVQSGGRTYLVQRHYIALHGLTGASLSKLKLPMVISDTVHLPYLHDKGFSIRKINHHDPSDQMFTHIDSDDGMVRNFHIPKLQQLIAAHQSDCVLDEMPIDESMVSFILAHNDGINDKHVDEMSDAALNEPGIVCAFTADGSFLTVDGNHRIIARARRKLETMKIWIVPEHLWKKCLLVPIYQRD